MNHLLRDRINDGGTYLVLSLLVIEIRVIFRSIYTFRSLITEEKESMANATRLSLSYALIVWSRAPRTTAVAPTKS